MNKRNEEWNTRETCFMLVQCIFLYALGVLLLCFKVLFGLGLILVATLFFIPSLTEANKKVRGYLKKRRAEKLRQIRETVIVGGTPQKHHKKKKQREPIKCPTSDDFVSKGKAMRELGLFYGKKQKKDTVTEITEPTKTSNPNRTYSQLNELFDALNYRKRIRIAHDANIGSGHHGSSIKKMAEAEAKRRGIDISVRMKGKDIIIESNEVKYNGEVKTHGT